jgi:hypothetical protein
MTTSAMLWGGASYNNGILPYKRYLLGEGLTRDGQPATIVHDGRPLTDEMRARGALEKLLPMPTWEVLPPADIFRVFERGGLFIKSQFAEVGNPNSVSDAGVGALCVRSAVMGAFMNVRINAAGYEDKLFVADIVAKGKEIESKTIAAEITILKIVNEKIGL